MPRARAVFGGSPHGVFGSLSVTFAVGAVVQGLAALAGFGAVPFLVSSLGPAQFGILVVIVSLGPWLTVFDGALAPATRVLVGESRKPAHGAAYPAVLRSGFRMSLRIMATTALVGGVLLAVLPLMRLFGASGVVDAAQLSAAIVLFAVPVVASAPGPVYQGAFEGVGRTVVSAVISGLGPILAFPLTVAAASAGMGLAVLAAIQGLSIAVPRFAAWAYWRWRPSLAAGEPTQGMGIGGGLVAQFAILAALALAQTGLAPLIVSSSLGPDAAAAFGMAWRLVSGALVPVAVLGPMFAAGIAAARGGGWSEKTDADLRRLVLQSGAVGTAAGASLLALGPPIARLLGDDQVAAPLSLYAAGAAFVAATYVSTSLTLAFTGPRALRTSVALGGILAVLSIAGSALLVRLVGVSGPLWAAAAAAAVAVVVWVVLWRVRPSLLAEVHA